MHTTGASLVTPTLVDSAVTNDALTEEANGGHHSKHFPRPAGRHRAWPLPRGCFSLAPSFNYV